MERLSSGRRFPSFQRSEAGLEDLDQEGISLLLERVRTSNPLPRQCTDRRTDTRHRQGSTRRGSAQQEPPSVGQRHQPPGCLGVSAGSAARSDRQRARTPGSGCPGSRDTQIQIEIASIPPRRSGYRDGPSTTRDTPQSCDADGRPTWAGSTPESQDPPQRDQLRPEEAHPIEMYPDRLRILNPGGLFGAVDITRLGEEGVSSSRNALLMKILEDEAIPG